MAKFVLVYTGGEGMASTPAEQEAMMAAWMAWFGSLGAGVIDGGNPLGASRALRPDGSVAECAGSGLNGYSILQAESIEAAVAMARGCPHLKMGGTVELFEVIPIG